MVSVSSYAYRYFKKMLQNIFMIPDLHCMKGAATCSGLLWAAMSYYFFQAQNELICIIQITESMSTSLRLDLDLKLLNSHWVLFVLTF